MKTAAQLIEEAKRLMDQAKAIQEANAVKIGKYVLSNIDKLAIDQLRAFVQEVTGEAVKTTGDNGKKPAAKKAAAAGAEGAKE